MIILCLLKMQWSLGESQKDDVNIRELSDKILELGKLVLEYGASNLNLEVLNILLVSMYLNFGPPMVESFISQELKSDLFYVLNEELNNKASIDKFMVNMSLVFDQQAMECTAKNKPQLDGCIEKLSKYCALKNNYAILNSALIFQQLSMNRNSLEIIKKLPENPERYFSESALLALCLCMIKVYNYKNEKNLIVSKVVPILKNITEFSQLFEGNGKKICLSVHMALIDDFHVILN